MAGGKDAKLVVIPSATRDSRIPSIEKVQRSWQKVGFQNVRLFHSRGPISDKELAIFDDATAIWFSGGDQRRLREAYVGTPFEEKLYELVRKGVVIGGSSAGAAIQSKVMIEGGDPIPRIGQGFALLPNAIIDQHFLKRSRLNRLIQAVKSNPKCIGVGIDESTVLVVNGDKGKVVGKSYVVLLRVVDNQLDIQSFSPGSAFRFSDFKIE